MKPKTEQDNRPNEQEHRLLALWAADCAEHVLPHFEVKYLQDQRPRNAIEAARAWARREIRCDEARAAALAAHAAAASSASSEASWQHRRLPEHLRGLPFPVREQ